MNRVTQHYIDQFNAAQPTLAGAGLSWLEDQRRAALERFRKLGFPGQQEEDWRYTPLKSLTAKSLQVNLEENEVDLEIQHYLIKGLDSYRLVFIDGKYSPQYSEINGLDDLVVVDSFEHVINVRPQRLAGANRTEVPIEHGFAALNVAFSRDGYVVDIGDNKRLDKPVEIVFVAVESDLVTQPRNIIHLGEGSKAEIIERYVSSPLSGSLVNSTTNIVVAGHSRLEYFLVQTLQNTVNQVASVDASLAEHGTFNCYTMTLGGRLVRNNLKIGLEAEGAHCEMLGLYNTSGKQHVDNHTTVVHKAPHCSSRELYKGVLDGRSRAVFHGRIKVEQGAQKTDAAQSNNNLLLSSNAEVDTKPQLEIYADDVKCAHGATIGQIDQNSLFYLRSRGINEEDARAMLTYAFLNDVLGEVEIEPLRKVIEAVLAERLIDDE